MILKLEEFEKAILSGDVDSFIYLLDHSDHDNLDQVIYFAGANNEYFLKILVEYGIDISPALINALDAGDNDTLRRLFEYGADGRILNDNPSAIFLNSFLQNMDTETIEILVEFGVNVEQALSGAVFSGDAKFISVILENSEKLDIDMRVLINAIDDNAVTGEIIQLLIKY